MSLEEKVKRAKKLTFVTIPNTPTATVGTWGSKDNFYRIRLTQPLEPRQTTIFLNRRYYALDNIIAECIQDHSIYKKNCDCPGNSKRTICYHAMGALMFILNDLGQEIEFCRDEIVAQGKVEYSKWDKNVNTYHFALIKSKQGGRSMWAVIRDKVKVVDHGNMKQRINSMRGNEAEEEGIN